MSDFLNVTDEQLRAELSRRLGGKRDPVLDAANLDAQAAAIMDIPNHLWNQEQKEIVRRQCQAVLQRGW